MTSMPEPGTSGQLQLNPRSLLQWIAYGVRNGNYGAVLDMIDEALTQLPEDVEFIRVARDAPDTSKVHES